MTSTLELWPVQNQPPSHLFLPHPASRTMSNWPGCERLGGATKYSTCLVKLACRGAKRLKRQPPRKWDMRLKSKCLSLKEVEGAFALFRATQNVGVPSWPDKNKKQSSASAVDWIAIAPVSLGQQVGSHFQRQQTMVYELQPTVQLHSSQGDT